MKEKSYKLEALDSYRLIINGHIKYRSLTLETLQNRIEKLEDGTVYKGEQAYSWGGTLFWKEMSL